MYCKHGLIWGLCGDANCQGIVTPANSQRNGGCASNQRREVSKNHCEQNGASIVGLPGPKAGVPPGDRGDGQG